MNAQNEKIDQIIEKFKNEKGTIIGLMQDIHGEYRYLPEEVLLKVSAELDIPMAKLYTLATFYKSFRLEPVGKHHVRVCLGTACHVNGATKIVETLERELGVKSGQTTEDNQFTLETVNCLGACALGPLMLVDGEYHGKIDQGKLKKLLNKYRKD
ncbi:MAG: NADH-quinone oxidoreductase subunit NuoE [Spirochaetes bacterium]|nr:NADH-quinone oxidoreductase subunit NuoE [Spirochaetota bacterium]